LPVIGDYGLAGQRASEVAALVKSWQPDFVITTGDNNYYYGEASTIDANIGQYYHDFIHPYVGQYGPGATTNRFFPSLGNHDWNSASGVQPYLDYFTLPGNERYYDFVWGPVNLFALDSDPREPDGTTPGSVQGRWLENRLAASTARWKLVYMHHPPYSSAHHGSSTRMQWPYETWGADAVLAAHDHTYERITDGSFPYFVNGLGGAARYQFGPAIPGSQVRYNADWGAMLVDASDDWISFRFFSRSGALIDIYTLYASPEVHPPDAPSALVTTSTSASEIALAWVDHASNESEFVIEQSTDGVVFTAIDTVGADTTTYAVTGLAASATYAYRVRARNGAGSSEAPRSPTPRH
jgi:tartrate-resistant acid phosphatase type 5